MLTIETYDPAGERFCASLPFNPQSPAKLVPGYKYDASWCGVNGRGSPRKVWHWPIRSLAVILRAFGGAEASEPRLKDEITLAAHINAARAITMERARSLALREDVIGAEHPNGKRLRGYQQAAVVRTLTGGGTRGLFHETGTGKTITTGKLIQMLTQAEPGLRKTVVVCPVTLIRSAWLPDLAAWFPELPLVNLRDYKKGSPRELAVANAIERHGRAVVLVNYETMKADPSVRNIMTGAYVVFDEVSKCKGYRSAVSETCRELAGQFRGSVILSGTPAPNDHQEYWPLIKIIAPAAGYDPFPGSRSVFAKEFLDVQTFTRRSEPGVEHFAGFTFRENLSARLHERMTPICEWLKKTECLDLPPKVFQRVPVDLEPATARAYDEMATMMRTIVLANYDSKEKLEAHAVNALAQMMKLRQITAGFVPAFPKDWASGGANAKALAEIGREKIDWLLEHCETSAERIVYWTQFEFEAERLRKQLEAASGKGGEGNPKHWLWSCAKVTGATPEVERAEIFKRFIAGEFQVLIAHPGVAQWGISLPGVSYAAYGSLSYSLQEFAQSQDRIHGIGRGDVNKKSTFYLLCARAGGAPTIDDDCVDILEGKKEALDFVFELDRTRRQNGFVPQDVGQRIDQ
jgi:superfamily II DNA or RNA helicase